MHANARTSVCRAPVLSRRGRASCLHVARLGAHTARRPPPPPPSRRCRRPRARGKPRPQEAPKGRALPPFALCPAVLSQPPAPGKASRADPRLPPSLGPSPRPSRSGRPSRQRHAPPPPSHPFYRPRCRALARLGGRRLAAQHGNTETRVSGTLSRALWLEMPCPATVGRLGGRIGCRPPPAARRPPAHLHACMRCAHQPAGALFFCLVVPWMFVCSTKACRCWHR